LKPQRQVECASSPSVRRRITCRQITAQIIWRCWLMNIFKDKVTQEEMNAVYKELQTPYKYGMVVTGTGDEGITNVDSHGVFLYGNKWYMTYVSHNENSEYGGYRTNLASSDNLLDWNFEGIVFQNSADYPQCAA